MEPPFSPDPNTRYDTIQWVMWEMGGVRPMFVKAVSQYIGRDGDNLCGPLAGPGFALQFARKVIETRGKVSDADLKAVRDAGYTDASVMEIVALVAMYSLTNLFNNVFDPEKDFPAVTPAGSI